MQKTQIKHAQRTIVAQPLYAYLRFIPPEKLA